MDLLALGTRWHHDTLPNVAASDVVYRVSGQGKLTVKATRGRRVHTADTSVGVTLDIKSPDWIITKSLLVLNGHPITPERGHEIVTPEGGIFEVCQIGDGEPPARDSDVYGNAWRIHSQFIGVQA